MVQVSNEKPAMIGRTTAKTLKRMEDELELLRKAVDKQESRKELIQERFRKKALKAVAVIEEQMQKAFEANDELVYQREKRYDKALTAYSTYKAAFVKADGTEEPAPPVDIAEVPEVSVAS